MAMASIAELRAELRAAQVALDYPEVKEFHNDPRGYWTAVNAAYERRAAAEKALDAARPCRFCDKPSVTQRWAGGYGSPLVCEDHIHTAETLAEDYLAMEMANGRALAQILKDERKMMRSS